MRKNNEVTTTVRAISEEEAMEALKGAYKVSQTKKSSMISDTLKKVIKAFKNVLSLGD